jgi:hypothetical protein
MPDGTGAVNPVTVDAAMGTFRDLVLWKIEVDPVGCADCCIPQLRLILFDPKDVVATLTNGEPGRLLLRVHCICGDDPTSEVEWSE